MGNKLGLSLFEEQTEGNEGMLEDRHLLGQRFGHLRVMEQAEPHLYLCQCDCGKFVTLRDTLLVHHFFTSCGCARGESRKRDITGIRSGMVVALEPTDEKRRGAVLWKCHCDCGREFETEGYKISKGVISSCGCVRKLHQNKDLTNQRFGRLVALHRLEKKRGSNYVWLCQCDCGKMTEVPTNALLTGGTKSCGCAKEDALKRNAKDISGQRFGRLVALEPTDRRMRDRVVWKCRCDCGREAFIPESSLTSGNTKSCGCLPREHSSPMVNMRYIDGTCVEMLERKKLRKDNTSGYTGVVAYRGRWKAQITFKRKKYDLGIYERIEDAVTARKRAEERIFGEFLAWYYETFQKKV